MVLIPWYIPVFSFFAERIPRISKHKTLCFAFFACVVCLEGIKEYRSDAVGTFKNDSGKQLIRASKMMDENTTPDDTIISLEINGYIYPFTKRAAVSKYIYQGSGLEHIPKERE
jgi:hypothetical protein